MILYALIGLFILMITDWILGLSEEDIGLNNLERLLTFLFWPFVLVYYLYTIVKLIINRENK
jgi:hypothetical protein